MKNIILSIQSPFVEKILSGKKTFEYRKKIPKDDIKYVLIYETAPIKKIVAIGLVDCILSEKPQNLWNKTFGASGIDKSFFDKYFEKSQTGYAIKFKQVFKLSSPLDLSAINCKTPPQSYSYYEGNIKDLLSIAKKIKVDNKLIFLGGVHGAGKSTYSEQILSAYGYNCISASKLISMYKGEVNINKTVSNIDNNQQILLAAIKKYQRVNYKVVIDGHFCVLDKKGIPQQVSCEIFKLMKPEIILLAEISEEQLKSNLNNREPLELSVSLKEFIIQEHKQAESVSNELKIPIEFINPFEPRKKLIKNSSHFLCR